MAEQMRTARSLTRKMACMDPGAAATRIIELEIEADEAASERDTLRKRVKALEADVTRLREQNREHATRRDREQAELQQRVARHEGWVQRARERMDKAAVDWTTDPPSQRPGGWWSYASSNDCGEVVALVAEVEALEAQRDEALKVLDAVPSIRNTASRRMAEARRILSGDGDA